MTSVDVCSQIKFIVYCVFCEAFCNPVFKGATLNKNILKY